MKSPKTLVRKERARPATGQDPVTAIRLSAAMRKKVDTWAAGQTDKPGRSETILRLVALGLEALPPTPKRSKKAAAKAAGMAGEMIDRLADKSASPEEQAKRKRRLMKGPPEFREMRDDLPKPKG